MFNMKKLFLLLFVVLALLVPASVFSFDLGVLNVDIGIPVLYTNTLDLVESDTDLVGNLRTGGEVDVIFNIVPKVFGIGLNTGVLFGVTDLINASNPASFVLDIPARVAVRIGWDKGYVQLQSGIIFTPVGPLSTVITSVDDLPPFRYVDVGARLMFGKFGLEGGYLISLPGDGITADIGNDLIPNTQSPFYIGAFFNVF